MVHILVTRRTGKLSEVIRDYFRSAQCLVARDACDGHVTSVQWEAGPLVKRERVAGGLECRAIVTLLAFVVPGSPRKLPCMFVLMAIDAERELDLETSFFPRGNMTRGTLYRGMRKDQRKAGLRMVSNRKC